MCNVWHVCTCSCCSPSAPSFAHGPSDRLTWFIKTIMTHAKQVTAPAIAIVMMTLKNPCEDTWLETKRKEKKRKEKKRKEKKGIGMTRICTTKSYKNISCILMYFVKHVCRTGCHGSHVSTKASPCDAAAEDAAVVIEICHLWTCWTS